MNLLQEYKLIFESYLKSYKIELAPSDMLEAFNYIMSLGGKRIRPLSVMMTHSFYHADLSYTMPAALATEVFHNFTLVHDDIMDRAQLRRGKDTTHIKYGINTAILTGDVMLIYAYKLLRQYPPQISVQLIDTVTDMSISLCEGQQMDIDFEQKEDVLIADYVEMIEKKTAVLFAACFKMGCITGGGPEKDGHHLFEFGKNIGIAFQIQDDILDIYGEQQKFGKNKCGDIVQNKKTYLYLKALELASASEKKSLLELYRTEPVNNDEKINQVLKIFDSTNVIEYANQVKEAYLDLAYSHLNALTVEESQKAQLKQLADYLVVRQH